MPHKRTQRAPRSLVGGFYKPGQLVARAKRAHPLVNKETYKSIPHEMYGLGIIIGEIKDECAFNYYNRIMFPTNFQKNGEAKQDLYSFVEVYWQGIARREVIHKRFVSLVPKVSNNVSLFVPRVDQQPKDKREPEK